MSLASGTTIEARYKVVTPCFCAGADPKQAEVRIPSFKGVLRFWWRALAWAEYGGDLGRIQKEEAELFGGPGKTGQSLVLMRLLSSPRPATPLSVGTVLPGPLRRGRTERQSTVGEGARYLGYGAVVPFGTKRNGKVNGELERGCLPAPFDVDVELRCRRELTDRQADLLRRALVALGLFGGLGFRSRNGYGSMNLHELVTDGAPRWRPPSDLTALREATAGILPTTSPGILPPYSAVAGHTRIILLVGEGEPLDLLHDIGAALKEWISGEETPRQSDQKVRHRAVFGLPRHTAQGQMRPSAGDRRASPLFLHIHQLMDKSPVAVLTFLPAQFLPKGSMAVTAGRGGSVTMVDNAQLYQPVHQFLDQFKHQPRPWLSQAIEVNPR